MPPCDLRKRGLSLHSEEMECLGRQSAPGDLFLAFIQIRGVKSAEVRGLPEPDMSTTILCSFDAIFADGRS